ncbi:type II toxin-antitoxin system RelE/ParE family toxin [Candidatus Aerophobetes bacterium]|nr:type II toxin-antitoxin system RelE/ParE family toxin [Candidatus Aerophobetes bacterium]
MAKFKVVIADIGKKDLWKIEANLRIKLLQKLKILENSPLPTAKSVKKIKISHKIPLFRLRFGNYRIIYHIRDTVVYIFAVVHRKDFDNIIKSIIKSTKVSNYHN